MGFKGIPFHQKSVKGNMQWTEYEKIKRITFPLEGNHLLLVTTEVDADHNKIISNILSILT